MSTVDALLPLSLLEAVRNVDTPVDALDTEFVPELKNKRLGLSDTVYTQIRRYTDAVKRKQRTARDEASALARLIGRRPDSEAVFRAAGRFLAREAYLTISPVSRTMIRILPSFFARPIAFRKARRMSRRYLNGQLSRMGSHLTLEVERSVTADAAPSGSGCAYYEAALKEMLRLLIGSMGGVDHVVCQERGEGTCEWRADWRPMDRKAMKTA